MVTDAHQVTTPSDVQNLNLRYDDEIAVYDLEALGVANFNELIAMACEAVATGGEVPEPFATGPGSFRLHYRCEIGSAELTDVGCIGAVGSSYSLDVSLAGIVTDDSGVDYRVRADVLFNRTETEEGPETEVRLQRTSLREFPS